MSSAAQNGCLKEKKGKNTPPRWLHYTKSYDGVSLSYIIITITHFIYNAPVLKMSSKLAMCNLMSIVVEEGWEGASWMSMHHYQYLKEMFKM